jgi:hypothetical protein
MKIILLPTAFAALLLLPPALCAQPAAKSPVPVNVTVGDITDSRTTGSFNAGCKVELKFTGDAAADARNIRKVHVKLAVDELGRDLIPAEDPNSFQTGAGFPGAARSSSVLRTEINLRNPSRNASVIKTIEGEVEFFNPSPANGGILVIKDILKHPAEPIDDATLKKYGVQMMYLTKESYEAKKKQLQQQPDAADSALTEAFGDLFKGMFAGMMPANSKNSVMLYVKDPDKRVIDMGYEDANGMPLHSTGSWQSNEMRNQEFRQPPPPDTQLIIYLATPESIQHVPFKIENIPLP